MGFYRYINYFIKCCIRRIVYSDLFWKILFLIIMFFTTSFLCNKIVYGAEVPSGYQIITPTIEYNIGIDRNGLLSYGDDNVILYYFPVYEGMPFGFDFDFKNSMNVFCYGFTEVKPAIGVQAISFGFDYNLELGFKSNIQESPIDGYAYYILGDKSQLSDVVFWIRESLYDGIQQQTSTIVTNQNENTDKILESQEEISESLTSTEYDKNIINIDTSVTDDIDDSDSTGLFTTVFENLSNLISSSNWSNVETIEIGLPYVDSKIELRSDILSKIVGNSLLKTLINVAWYSLFGLYVFRFVTSIYHSIKSGNILNGINFDNEVISSTML